MNWFMRIFPQWHVNEKNLTREFEKIFYQEGPMDYGQVQAAVIDVATAFGIVDGSFFITWFALPRTRQRGQEREAGEVTVRLRLVTFRNRIKSKEDIFTLELERRWYAPISKQYVLAAQLQYEPGCEPWVSENWRMTPLAETADQNFFTTVEELR